MSEPHSKGVDPVRAGPAAIRVRWWGKLVTEGQPPQTRLAFRWGRILGVVATFCLAGYLALFSALWGYYAIYRHIPGVSWIDVVVLPRFPRAQAAIGAYYFDEAKQLWTKQNFVPAIFMARAAVVKSPRNLDARLFLASCWLQAGRSVEAVRAIEDGIAFNADSPRLQQAFVAVCVQTGQFQVLLNGLRQEFPAHGVSLLTGTDRGFQLAEVRAVFETTNGAEAEKVVASHPGLANFPEAAPLLARIDWDLGRHDESLQRLAQARVTAPNDPEVQNAYVQTALRLGKTSEARSAATTFRSAYPNLLDAQLRFLEAYGSRQGADRLPWIAECLHFLAQYRHDPDALGQLGSLAAAQGWSDLAYLLYQNSLQERLTGFPFAIYYAASLVKAGNAAAADAVWHELSTRNAAQLAPATYLAAMVAWGAGRESEALQIADQLQRETASDPSRRRLLEETFRAFGFPKIADRLAGGSA